MNARANGSTNAQASAFGLDPATAAERYAKIVRASPIAIGVTEAKSGLVLEINEAFERTFKATREQTIGSTMVRFWRFPEDRERMLQVFEKQGYLRDYEVLARTFLDEPIVVLLNAERIAIGEVECLVTYAHDVTAQRKLERARAESEEKFSKAFQAAPYGASIVDLETDRYLDINQGFERLFGCRREQVVGMRVTDLPFWAEPEERQRYLELVRRLGSVHEMPANGRRSDGSWLRGLASATTIEVGGRLCLLTFARDVTEQLEAERARADLEAQLRDAQKLEALGTLAGGIAHDFNNILHAITAYAELLEIDSADPQSVKSHVAELQVATGRARDLVKQILTFSRRHPHERRPTDLGPIVGEVTRLLRSTLPSTIELETFIAADAPVVMADSSHIHQVLLNLGTNAAHAIGSRPGVINIRLERVEITEVAARSRPDLRSGIHALLTVSDTGCGMDPYTCQRIFEPFFTTKATGEGTGLGLAVVHGIMRDHEGSISVRSQRGEGTTFELYFPEHAAALSEEHELSTALLRGRGEHILLVDDEAALRFATKVLLERLGYSVVACADPVEALQTFGRNPLAFDLVLTDLTMPHMSGIDFAKQLLLVRPAIRVIMMSGYSPTWTIERLREVGVCALLAKPVMAHALSNVMRNTLDGRQL